MKKIHPIQYFALELAAETSNEAKEMLKTVKPYTKEELFQKEQRKLKRAVSKIKFAGE